MSCEQKDWLEARITELEDQIIELKAELDAAVGELDDTAAEAAAEECDE